MSPQEIVEMAKAVGAENLYYLKSVFFKKKKLCIVGILLESNSGERKEGYIVIEKGRATNGFLPFGNITAEEILNDLTVAGYDINTL